MSLAEAFLPHAGRAAEALREVPDLETILGRLLAEGRAGWPAVGLPDADFLRHLAERVSAGDDPPTRLARVHAGDLYLACACAAGRSEALSLFEGRFLAAVPSYVALGNAPPGFVDELKQELRARLLVASGRDRPRIADYSGEGPLGAWLRVAAARAAVDLHRSRSQHADIDGDRDLRLRAPGADPEILYLKTRYRAEFEEAFRTTLVSLPLRDANVLRLHFFDGLAPRTIAALFRVSVRTVQHWMAQSRQEILEGTRRLLQARLDLSTTELDGLIGLLQSQLDVSIRKSLGKVGR